MPTPILKVSDLPNDIFLLIITYLSPQDIILNRRVSKAFHAAFTESTLNRQLLFQRYPRVRELRIIDSEDKTKEVDWTGTFQKVAARYHRLQKGTPHSIEKLSLSRSFVAPKWSRHYPIAPWKRYLQFEEKVAPFHYPDTLWTYSEGILIFPSAEMQTYALYDLDSGMTVEIDIESESNIVRRISLKERVLIVEWCEEEAYHQLNENEEVNRHFATAYDVIRDSVSDKWKIVQRNEWKIHFLGMPLNSTDRFFSTHDANRYALYLWQPNRSAWGEDEPIESLAVWDISSPSSYRPSQDPAGSHKPGEAIEGPKVIMRLSFSDLDFYGIRQRATPVLQRLELDDSHVYIILENHRWIIGEQASYTLPKLHEVKTVGIPFAVGPRWEDSCGVDGDEDASFCERSSDIRGPHIPPCWRHQDFPYMSVAEVVDSNAGVIFSARQCFMLEVLSLGCSPKLHVSQSSFEISLKDDLWPQLLAKGKICGEERWLVGENTKQEVVILRW